MHSCEPSTPAPPAQGAALLLELGRLIVRARRGPAAPAAPHERALAAKLAALRRARRDASAAPSTSGGPGDGEKLSRKQLDSDENPIQRALNIEAHLLLDRTLKQQQQQHISQPDLQAPKPPTDPDEKTKNHRPELSSENAIYINLKRHVDGLWNEHIPCCIEVLMASECEDCLGRLENEGQSEHKGALLLLERWSLSIYYKRAQDTAPFITSQWLLNAVRSQLHFSQISAWSCQLKEENKEAASTTKPLENGEAKDAELSPTERQRKLSREMCNFKKLESNCDEEELPGGHNGMQTDEEKAPLSRSLNVVYTLKIPGETYKVASFIRKPTTHVFPITDIGSNVYLKVTLECLPRLDEIPNLQCPCRSNGQSKHRSKEYAMAGLPADLAVKISSLTMRPEARLIRPDLALPALKLEELKHDLSSRLKGAKFSPDLGIINPNIGCSSGISRRLSIFSNANAPEASLAGGDPSSRVTTPDHGLRESPSPAPRSRSQSGDRKQDLMLDNPFFGKSLTLSHNFESENVVRANYLLVDDRMHTPCSENGKHRCNCDEESDGAVANLRSSGAPFGNGAEQADEKRLREMAKQRRRLRKEMKLKKLREGGTSESGGASETSSQTGGEAGGYRTSIPILQAGRLRAMGAYRCHSYLPLGRVQREAAPPATACAGTQTEETWCACACGEPLQPRCLRCRSAADRLLAALERTGRLKRERDPSPADANKKHNCDSKVSDFYKTCDNKNLSSSIVDNDSSLSGDIIRRPRLKRLAPVVSKLEQIVCDRQSKKQAETCESAGVDEKEYVEYDRSEFERATVSADGFQYPSKADIPSTSEMDRFRWRLDSAASMVFHTRTGLPLTSSPAPLRKGKSCFDYDSSINGVSGIKSALFHPKAAAEVAEDTEPCWSPGSSPGSPRPAPPGPVPPSPPPLAHVSRPAARDRPERSREQKLRLGPSSGLLGSFEESALKGRLEPAATVAGFTAELGASGAFCPPHRRLPVTVFFYALGGTAAPYLGHINLGARGYRVPRSGTVQVTLFNPLGTVVKMFVVLYDLAAMPAGATTFLRQRTLYMPAQLAAPTSAAGCRQWLRYLIHLRFLTSKSGKLYLHTDIRIIVSRKADLDTATAHTSLILPGLATSLEKEDSKEKDDKKKQYATSTSIRSEPVNRVFGGCDDEQTSEEDYQKYNFEQAKSDYEFMAGKKMNRSEACSGLAAKCKNKSKEDLTETTDDINLPNCSKNIQNVASRTHNRSQELVCSKSNVTNVQNAMRNQDVTGSRSNCTVSKVGNASCEVSYELRSFTYSPENPKFSPR